ncbi:hypothetical protein [Psychrobium sp. 1_MG-2023]|uniref:hypothetical protein n=1 Tax=Psychrobium sp. 1_MG-2023 TaxID=3062624 RepID=UPI000C31EAFF|nr:hypothetical protein [Psychrobium sp. 1_MG-2023]MDP2562825.1 hypothetical protein [Psychrobium sp. 1_MG-2023]PKF57955.1 hypothetical protein CW748_05395 [Alteromonadales bacterium alter-6D02]
MGLLKVGVYLSIICLLCFSKQSFALQGERSIWVIASAQSQDQQLSLQQVKKTYLGMKVTLSNGLSRQALTYPLNSSIRSLFNVTVIGLTESRIKTFWAQMRFTGRGSAAKVIADEQALFQYLIKNPNTIGYVLEGTQLPQEIKVLYTSL